MWHATKVLTAVAIAGGASLADQITIRNIPYASVRVTGAANCKIVYELRGRDYDKPFSDVDYVYIAAVPALKTAEDRMKEGKAAEAVAAYDKVPVPAGLEWLGRLVRYRRLRAADKAGMIDRAVADWLGVVKECAGSAASAALVPKTLGEPKSAANAKAVGLLEEALKSKATPAFQAAVKELLMSLYEREGMTDKAAVLSGDGGDKGGKAPAVGPTKVGPTTITVSSGSLRGQLGAAADQIQAGQYRAAADAIGKRIHRYDDRELPTALLLRGKALLMLYEKGPTKDRKLLLQAGLCFMRVAACISPSEPEVPEATFLAGRVCQHLGNRVAAENAYRLILQRHPGTEWAKRARQALAAP